MHLGGADCVPAYCTPTAGESDKGKDFNVLSRFIRASRRRARRHIRIPRSLVAPVPGNC